MKITKKATRQEITEIEFTEADIKEALLDLLKKTGHPVRRNHEDIDLIFSDSRVAAMYRQVSVFAEDPR